MAGVWLRTVDKRRDVIWTMASLRRKDGIPQAAWPKAGIAAEKPKRQEIVSGNDFLYKLVRQELIANP